MEIAPSLPPRSQSKKGSHKYKKIVSHLSNFLHGKTSSVSAPKKSSQNKLEISNSPEFDTEVYSEKYFSSSDIKEDLKHEPAYSTIKEVTAVIHEPAEFPDAFGATSSAPKDIDKLYAKVKKKSRKTTSNDVPSSSLENVPGSSSLPHNSNIQQLDINCNVAQNEGVKKFQGTELQSSETLSSVETNVDELQTWNLLLKHQQQQQQHTKKPSQVKLNPRKFPDHYRVANHSQKQISSLKKDVFLSERCSHHSRPNFSTSSGKPTRYSHYRSLEDFSTLAASKEDVNKMWEECQEEIMKFQQKMEQVVVENKILHQHVHSLLQKEAKWKEEKESILIHKQENHLLTQKNNILLHELSALHEQKEKEAKHLSYEIQHLQSEKNNLLERLHSMLHEKEALEIQHSKMSQKNSQFVSYEVHTEAIQENQKVLNDMKKKHQEDMNRILKSCRDIENEKNDLSVQVHILKEDANRLHQNNSSLKRSLEEALKIKDRTLSQLEQSKQQNLEMQDLLGSLLKLAEEAMTERDVALTKAEFQENQQTRMQGTVVEHSIAVGRLQEHIMNIKKRVTENIRTIEMR